MLALTVSVVYVLIIVFDFQNAGKLWMARCELGGVAFPSEGASPRLVHEWRESGAWGGRAVRCSTSGVCTTTFVVKRKPRQSFGFTTFQPSPMVISKRQNEAEMSFLRRASGVSLRDRVRSSDIWRELWIDAPLRWKEPVEVARPLKMIDRWLVKCCLLTLLILYVLSSC